MSSWTSDSRHLSFDERLVTRLIRIRPLASGAVLGIAGLVLLGWALDIPMLKSVLPGLSQMKPNTAVGFVLEGLALGLWRPGQRAGLRHRSAVACAGTAVLIGLVTLGEYVLGWDLGVDELLFRDSPGAVMTYAPGRMGPNTAVNFVLLGAALLLSLTTARDRLAQLLALCAAAIALTALIGYLQSLISLYRLASYTPMALHTAIGGLLLSIGLLCARPDRGLMAPITSAESGGRMARRLLPLSLALMVVLGWLVLAGEKAGLYVPELGAPLFSMGAIIAMALLIGWQAAALNRLDIRFRRTSEVVREAEQRYRATVYSIVEGIITIDEHGAIQALNPAAERIFGYHAAELIGKNIRVLMPEPYRSKHDDYIAHYIATGEARIIGIGREVEGLRKDGSVFPLDLAVNEFYVGDRRFFVGSVRDITERKHIERMKDEFIATVSHELKTPLTAIAGSLGLLNGGVAGELPLQAKSMVQIAYRNSERLAHLIKDILDISKIESGPLTFEPKAVDLAQLAADAIETSRPYAMQFEVELVLERAAPGILVQADTDRLLQALTNLLSNAVKFSPRGGQVTVRVERRGDQVRVSVTDRGPGIPEDFRDRVFQKFSQANGSDARAKGGAGLGLAIAKAIVERHGGSIAFESRAGQGATFYFELPCRLG